MYLLLDIGMCGDPCSHVVAPGFHLVLSVSLFVVFLGVRCGHTNISVNIQDFQKR